MPKYKVFTIPRNIINQNLPRPKKWEKFDHECKRANIKLDDNTLDKILSYSGKNFLRNGDNYTIHRIKYNLKEGEYIIDEHQDSCKFTIIIYIEKSPEIKDDFWVGNSNIKENVWSKKENEYNCLIFWGNSPHKGKIYGKGNREILCFFCD